MTCYEEAKLGLDAVLKYGKGMVLYFTTLQWRHMSFMTSQFVGNCIIHSSVCLRVHQWKHQRPELLALGVRGINRWLVDSSTWDDSRHVAKTFQNSYPWTKMYEFQTISLILHRPSSDLEPRPGNKLFPEPYLSSYSGYFREPHWLSVGLPEISRVTWQVCMTWHDMTWHDMTWSLLTWHVTL